MAKTSPAEPDRNGAGGAVLRRFLIGDRETIAGTVYGTIIVLSVIAAGRQAYEHHLWRLAALTASSAAVLWVAHVYSHGLGESLQAGRRLTMAEITAIARREYSIVLAAVLPVATLAAGGLKAVPDATAVHIAFGVGVLTLAAQAVRYGRLERLGPAVAATMVTINLALGLTIVAVEVAIAH